MKILKRNQIIISVIALMLITVGYMNFTSNITMETGMLMDAEQVAGIGDARLVNSNNVVENNNQVSIETAESSTNNQNENEFSSSVSINNNVEQQEVSANSYNNEYFVTSKLERDKMYSQMLETYQGLLESSTISQEQKNISTEEITKINNIQNSIMIAENLIKNLGFEDVIIFVNDNSTSVIIKAEDLQEADIAQIQNIVCRELGVEVESVHISLK